MMNRQLNVEHIPLNTTHAEHYITYVKKLNRLPVEGVEIYYSDIIWDFSEYFNYNKSRSRVMFNFGRIPKIFIEMVKDYILIKLLENRIKIQSLVTEFSYVCLYFRYLNDRQYYNIADIPAAVTRLFFESSDNMLQYRERQKCVKNFYVCYQANFGNIDINGLSEALETCNYMEYKTVRRSQRHCDIPSDYYNRLLSAICEVANSCEHPEIIRAIACIYIILSQTGLRISEALSLRIGSLETVKSGNHEMHSLKYIATKPCKGNKSYVELRTYANRLTKSAFDTLLGLFEQQRKETGLDVLYLGCLSEFNAGYYPLDSLRFTHHSTRFFIYMDRLIPTINLPEDANSGFTRVKYYKSTTITYPGTAQFRVHACTELYKKGIPLSYINKFMGHLSAEMTGYYVRPAKNNPQENMEFSLTTLRQIVSGEAKPLGGTKGFMNKISEFIKENNYNVEKDLDAICGRLAEKIPIRQKTGGVCIKSSMLRECHMDAQTNEFYCAYGVCSNIFHFYYMANVSYRQFLELRETIALNTRYGHIRQVEKESNMLSVIVEKKLQPELRELQKVIEIKGIDAVIREYPDLEEVVRNIDHINEEIKVWKTLN